jgi:hypothetical protein
VELATEVLEEAELVVVLVLEGEAEQVGALAEVEREDQVLEVLALAALEAVARAVLVLVEGQAVSVADQELAVVVLAVNQEQVLAVVRVEPEVHRLALTAAVASSCYPMS